MSGFFAKRSISCNSLSFCISLKKCSYFFLLNIVSLAEECLGLCSEWIWDLCSPTSNANVRVIHSFRIAPDLCSLKKEWVSIFIFKRSDSCLQHYPVWAVGCERRLMACHMATGFLNDVIIWFQCLFEGWYKTIVWGKLKESMFFG